MRQAVPTGWAEGSVRLRRGGAARAAALAAAAAMAWTQETDPTDGRPAWRFEEIASGVFFATGTGAMTTMSNSLVIVNEDHAVLVDTTVSPAAARKLAEEIRAVVTEKPVRYVINTHHQFDHSHGNQVFGADVAVVGHEFVRRRHRGDPLRQRTYRTFTAAIPGQVEAVRARLEGTSDPAERARIEIDLRVREAHWNAIQQTEVRPPEITYRDRLTLAGGGREVELHFVGRGHTGGDTIVFLPAERIVFTGDFFLGGPGANALPYMGDAYVDEWPASLERLKGLDFDVIVPGHGAPFRERSQIGDLQRYLRDLWRQLSASRARGLPPEQAARALDLSAHEPVYGARARSVDPRAVLRIYEILQIRRPF